MTQFTDVLGQPLQVGDRVAYAAASNSSAYLRIGKIIMLDPLVPDPRAQMTSLVPAFTDDYVRESQLNGSRPPTPYRRVGRWDSLARTRAPLDPAKLYVPVIEVDKRYSSGKSKVTLQDVDKLVKV